MAIFGTDGTDLSDRVSLAKPIPIGLFQGLGARKGRLPRRPCRGKDASNQDRATGYVLGPGHRRRAGSRLGGAELCRDRGRPYGKCVAADGVGDRSKRAEEIHAQQERAWRIPHLPPALDRELSWEELASIAFPLDFQKVLVASAHDASPGFVFQNGQWLTTWLSRDLPKWTKEDHWFAPALLIDDQLVRPAPLSARTGFVTTDTGRTLPLWTLEWDYQGATVRQWIFSHPATDGVPHVYVRLQIRNAPKGVRLALGVGRRPNAHYWDNPEHERTPIPFFTLPAGYRQADRQLIDAWDHLILESAQPFELEAIGPVEMLLTFAADEEGNVDLRTPQAETVTGGRHVGRRAFCRSAEGVRAHLVRTTCGQGAQATLPSAEWMKRIDIWRSQVAAITRVHYQGQERLELRGLLLPGLLRPGRGLADRGPGAVGSGEEARRQADIMLSAENREQGQRASPKPQRRVCLVCGRSRSPDRRSRLAAIGGPGPDRERGVDDSRVCIDGEDRDRR